MFKRLLGIHKLEKNFKIVGESLNRSWEWINHLNELTKKNEERLLRIEKSQAQLLELSKELLSYLQKTEEPKAPVQIRQEQYEQPVNNSQVSEKDLFLLQLMHQYAAFNEQSSVDTNTIFSNLTYKITQRGLRKKLNSLENNGFLKSIKRGNVRYWYLSPGALSKIKKALKEKE